MEEGAGCTTSNVVYRLVWGYTSVHRLQNYFVTLEMVVGYSFVSTRFWCKFFLKFLIVLNYFLFLFLIIKNVNLTIFYFYFLLYIYIFNFILFLFLIIKKLNLIILIYITIF